LLIVSQISILLETHILSAAADSELPAVIISL
jgi:hypothetical protein